MIGGRGFAFARARAARPALLTLLLVAAVAAALIVGMAVALRAIEAQDVRASLAAVEGERGQAVVSAPDGDAAALEGAVRDVLAAHGVTAVDTVAAGGRVTITPDAGSFAGDDVGALAAALRALPAEVRAEVGARAQVTGGLGTTLGVIAEGLQSRRGPTAVAIGLLGLLTVVVVGAVALEPVRARAGESLLLRARGARKRSLAALAGTETLLIAGVGAAIGAGVAFGVAELTRLPSPGWLFALLTSLAVAVAATVVAVVVVVRTVDTRTTRAQVAAFTGVAVVLAVVTGLAAWQFSQSGTPIIARGDGSAALDPLVAMAPALVLGLAALAAVLLATPLARLVAALFARTRSVAPVTPLRLAGRRPARHALPITVVAFAAGIATIASAYHGTVIALGDAPEALRVGADVRVTTIPDTVDVADIAETAVDAGADATAVARSFTAQGPGARIPVIAMEGGEVGAVMLDAGGTIDPAELGEAIRLKDAGIPLAGDTLELTVLAPEPPPIDWGDGETYRPQPALANVRLTFVSDAGALWEYGFINGTIESEERDDGTWTAGEADAEHRERIALPAGSTWSLIGIGTALVWYDFGATIRIADVSSGGQQVDLSIMTPAPGTPGSVQVEDGELVLEPTYSDSGQSLLTRAVGPGAPDAAPVVLTETLAASLSLAEGDRIALEFDGPDFEADVEVARIVPVLPGTPTGQGLLADIATLSLVSVDPIVPNQLWVGTDAPDAVASAIVDAHDAGTVLVADPRQGDAAARTAWAFELAATGAVLLAVVVLLLRRTRTRADARELALFTVMGLGRRRAAALRTAEDLFALLMGVLGGVAAGVLTAWLVVPPLVRAAYGTVPVAYPVPLVWPWLWLVAGIVLIVAVCVAVVASVRAPRGLATALREDE